MLQVKLAANLSGDKKKIEKKTLYFWLKINISVRLVQTDSSPRLDNELANCELRTGVVMFMDDQSFLKSLGQ